MALWRLKWMAAQCVDLEGFRGHRAVLSSPSDFYWGMLATLLVHARKQPLLLRLREGGTIRIRQFMSLYIYKEIFVGRCYDVALGAREPIIVDVGANTGMFALRMKQLYPQARITCYEPFAANFQELEETIRANALTDVTPVQKAVGASAGVARLYIHRRNVGGHSFFAQEADSKDCVEVEVLDISRVLEAFERPVDLLKLDCEGAEYEILMSLTPRTAKLVSRVVVEPTPRLYDIGKLKMHMQSVGYHSMWKNGLYEFVRP